MFVSFRDQNNTLSSQLQKIAADMLAAAKLDSKQRHLIFEKSPGPEKK